MSKVLPCIILIVASTLTACANKASEMNYQPTSLVEPASPTPANGTTQVF